MADHNNPLDDYVSHTLAAAHRQVHTSLASRLKTFGIQLEAWRVMETLDEIPAVTMSELATLVLMNPPTLTKLVDRMVSDGLVQRQIGKHDHRQVNLLLTDLGLKRMLQIRGEVKSADEHIVQVLGKGDTLLLNGLLKKLSAAADA